jgi:pseudomonalisin
MSIRRALLLSFTFSLLALISPESAPIAERVTTPLSVRPRDRVRRAVNDDERVALRANVHPSAIRSNEFGTISPRLPMERMVLLLRPDDEQQKALDKLLEAQHDPASNCYHQWLTPESFGESFGISAADLAEVNSWLRNHGLHVDEVMPSRQAVVFSGTVAQVQSAFNTPILQYKVGAETHHANSRDPEIPQALATVVGGVLSLHDFRSQAMHSSVAAIAPQFTSGSAHYLAPADFAVIYDLDPLYENAISGPGQSIAIVGRSNFSPADVRLFRSSFGLPGNDPVVIVNGSDPGIPNASEELEALLDVEWSGAVARDAKIKFVTSRSTAASDGVFLSSQYVVNHNLAPVMSVSFGLCEAALGSSGNSFFNNLWKQAAAQGITVFVSSGDSGAAGCDSPSVARASKGKGVNGICSSPYSVCVGGTQFNDANNASLYWSSANQVGSLASAFSYIPETVWNESGTRGLWSSGGGASSIYSKPSWQTGIGVPSDNKRDVPDVAFTSAAHDGYMMVMHGGYGIVAGTSAASPAWAGLMALVVQSTGSRQGNANSALYSFAVRQQSGGASVFHDVISGNNTVPGVAGYSSSAGYDLATGLGSPDAHALVAHWNDLAAPANFQIRLASAALTVAPGKSAVTNLTIVTSNGFNAPVPLSATSLPAGMTITFSPATLPPPGSGRSAITVTTRPSFGPGTYVVTVSASGAGVTQVANLTVNVPDFSLVAGAPSSVLAKNASVTVRITTTALGGFNSPIAFSVSGVPRGVTASFSPLTMPAPGSGVGTLTLTRKSGGATGASKIAVTSNGAGISRKATIALTMR